MDRLTDLLKEHQVGTWCKRAAWIIVAIGLIQIIPNIYVVVLMNQQQNYGGPLPWLYNLQVPLSIIAQTTFFFFILYATGVLVDHFVTDTEDNEKDELIVEKEGDDLISSI